MACLRRDTLLALRGVRLELERELNLPLDALRSQKDRIKVLIDQYFNAVASRQYFNTEEPELGEEEWVAEEAVQEAEEERVADEEEEEDAAGEINGDEVLEPEEDKVAEKATYRIPKRKRKVRGALIQRYIPDTSLTLP